MSNHDTQVLNTLIATTLDSALGFEAAAADASNTRLKTIFTDFASERRQIATTLQNEVTRLGGTAETEGTVKAAAHRRWMDLKNAIVSGDGAVIKSVEAGETYIRTKYEAALADEALASATRDVITDAYMSVARGQARAIELRRCLGLSGTAARSSVFNLGTLGTAAALGGLAFGAVSLLGLRRRRDRETLRIEADENLRLISSKKVEGTPVVGRNGERLGTIDSFMVDKYTGRVAYALMSFGGTMGFGGSLFPLPWSALTYDVDEDGYRLNISKDELANAPRFEPNDEPEFSPAYQRSIVVFYRPARSGHYTH